MRKLTDKEQAFLERCSNFGDLGEIEVPEGFDLGECEIIGNIFRRKNTIGTNTVLLGSIFQGAVIDRWVRVVKSTVVSSVLGRCTVVKNNSVVKDTVCSPLAVPVLSEGKKKSALFTVLINNSQLDGDAVLGGTDMRKTKSRGASVFAFAHLGEGEFTKNMILGTQPDAESQKKIANVAHFGYYGKMIILGLGVYDGMGNIPDINSPGFYRMYRDAFIDRYFGAKTGVKYETGRSNIGSGASMSDYDPVKDTKSGAVVLLASTGTDVSIPPYFTMLYHSLLASGSVDSAKHLAGGILGHGDLGVTTREKSYALPGYYIQNEKRILNDRCIEEMKFVIRYLRFLWMLSSVAGHGAQCSRGVQKAGWIKASEIIRSVAGSVRKRWLDAYLDTLEKHSIPGLKRRIMRENSPRLEQKLMVQERLLAKRAEFTGAAQRIMDDMPGPLQMPEVGEIYLSGSRTLPVLLTPEQAIQLRVSIVSLPREVDV